jgi:hypothetical protein
MRCTSRAIVLAETATLIADENPARARLHIQHDGLDAAYVGGADVTASNGYPLMDGCPVLELSGPAAQIAVYGAGKDQTVAVLEVIDAH